jgi:hypothetical protein
MSSTIRALERLGACFEARQWLKGQADQSPGALWAACDRSEWIIWLLGATWFLEPNPLDSRLVPHLDAYRACSTAAWVAYGEATDPAQDNFDRTIGDVERAYSLSLHAAEAVYAYATDVPLQSRRDAWGAAESIYDAANRAARDAYTRNEPRDYPGYSEMLAVAKIAYLDARAAAEDTFCTAKEAATRAVEAAKLTALETHSAAIVAAREVLDPICEAAQGVRDAAMHDAEVAYCDAIRSVYKRPTLARVLKSPRGLGVNDIPF